MGKVSGFILPIGVALVILIYTTLAVLTLTTARADNHFADRNIEFNQKYYVAQGKFEEICGNLASMTEKERLDLAKNHDNLRLVKATETGYQFEFKAEITKNIAYSVDFTLDLEDNIIINARGVLDTSQWEDESFEVWDG